MTRYSENTPRQASFRRNPTYALGFVFVLTALFAFGLTGCPNDDDPESDAGFDASVDAGVDPRQCVSSTDCVGDFAGQQCVAGMCTDCEGGALECSCRANGTCEEGLRCEEDSCVECVLGQESCACNPDDGCDDGLVCQSGVCFSNECNPGDLDCPCDNGICEGEGLFCDDVSVCRVCTSDIAGCPCDQDDSCQGDNFCDTTRDPVCMECPANDKAVGCVCRDTNDCEAGLVCDEDARRCREKKGCDDLCVSNQECDTSFAGDPVCVFESCVEGFVWDPDTESCIVPLEQTCDGRDGTENLSTQCNGEGKACVEVNGQPLCVHTCQTLGSTCATEQRDCEPSVFAGQDAVCSACLPGYANQGSGTCVQDLGANCSPIQNPGTIAATCDARNQRCDPLPGGGAECGACLEGFEFDTTLGGCVEKALCGGRLCSDDEYCSFPQSGEAPFCAAKSCAAGQSLDPSNGTCETCNLQCDEEGVYPTLVDGACACASDVFCSYQTDGSQQRCFISECADGEAMATLGQCISCANACGTQEGERARLWPKTTVTGECMCETREGFYRPFGNAGSPRTCDQDRDGWINRTAKATYDTASDLGQGALTQDEATLSNFRCELRRVDRFTLLNEWGQRRHVSVCGDDMIDYEPGTTPACNHVDGIKTVVLFESDGIDALKLTNDPVSLPLYGTRTVKGEEVNALTKLCVSLTGDFNDNQVEDVLEQQAIGRQRLAGANTSTDESFAFSSLSHYAELHTSTYVPSTTPGAPGSYLIAERSRCASGFPLTTSEGASGYWQSCSRNRRGDYLFSASHVGHDFGHYSCSGSASGSCEMPEPAVVTPEVDADGDSIPDHGVCDQTAPLADAPWRGMTHHSQFQCVVVDQSLPRASLYSPQDTEPQPYDFNTCSLEDCPSNPGACVETTSQGEYQPSVPELVCESSPRDQVMTDQVGWVNVRYLGETAIASLSRPYVRGCIDESFGLDGTQGWTNLCPGFEANPDSVLAAGNLGNSGKLICSCNANYGGVNCEVACKERLGVPNPTRFLHVGDRDRGYEVAELQEFACDPASKYCALHPPELSEGFGGGRRGYWMCGDTSLSLSTNTNGAVVPSLEASATVQGAAKTYELRGGVQNTPVVREELKFTGPVRGQNRTYKLF